MERYIIGAIMLLSCVGSAMAQDAKATSGCVSVRHVTITMATENLNDLYVKFFDSGLPIDNGTGVRQEEATVPRFALTDDDKKYIKWAKEHSTEILTNNGEQIVIQFTIMATGEAQIRQKSWMGMRDRALTGIRNGVVTFKSDLVLGMPVVSEAIQKCF
jgi:hypothetical protein